MKMKGKGIRLSCNRYRFETHFINLATIEIFLIKKRLKVYWALALNRLVFNIHKEFRQLLI